MRRFAVAKQRLSNCREKRLTLIQDVCQWITHQDCSMSSTDTHISVPHIDLCGTVQISVLHNAVRTNFPDTLPTRPKLHNDPPIAREKQAIELDLCLSL
jgi:hypothetical protein